MEVVTLDARLTKQMSVGMKRYVRELVHRLPRVAPDLTFIALSNAAFELPYANARTVLLRDAQANNGGIAEQFLLTRRLAQTGGGLVHFMSVYAPRNSRLRHVYTIHDLIHLRFPQYFSWKVPPYYKFVVQRVALTAKLLLTDARSTVADLQQYLDIAADKVRIVPLAAGEDFYLDETTRTGRTARARQRFGINQPYFLYAGNHRQHKNLEVLQRAWNQLQQPCDLVLTEEGDFGFPIHAVSKTNGRIVLVGQVLPEELIDLYAGCMGAIQPSKYEGFGLGVLEAMAAGAPAVVANTPALVEVGGDAVLTFNSGDDRDLESQMRQLLMDSSLRERLREAGRQRAQNFSWDETARRTAAVYREALTPHA